MASSKAIPISSAVLRILTLLLLGASIALTVTNTYNFEGEKSSFKDIIAYRYVLATACAGSAYTLIQIPFAIYYAVTAKRLIGDGCLPEFDFYGDKIIALLLGTGAGAGFAISFELKRFLPFFLLIFSLAGGENGDEFNSKIRKFLDRANIATGLLFLGFLVMAVLSILSSLNRTTTTTASSRGKGFFFR